MLIETSLGALALQKIDLSVGDTLRVVVSITYRVSKATTLTVTVVPYALSGLFKTKLEQEQVAVTKDVALPATTTLSTIEESFDIQMVPHAEGGLLDDTYGLRARDDQGNRIDIDNAFTLSGNPAGIIESMTSLIIVMLMMNMIGMMDKD